MHLSWPKALKVQNILGAEKMPALSYMTTVSALEIPRVSITLAKALLDGNMCGKDVEGSDAFCMSKKRLPGIRVATNSASGSLPTSHLIWLSSHGQWPASVETLMLHISLCILSKHPQSSQKSRWHHFFHCGLDSTIRWKALCSNCPFLDALQIWIGLHFCPEIAYTIRYWSISPSRETECAVCLKSGDFSCRHWPDTRRQNFLRTQRSLRCSLCVGKEEGYLPASGRYQDPSSTFTSALWSLQTSPHWHMPQEHLQNHTFPPGTRCSLQARCLSCNADKSYDIEWHAEAPYVVWRSSSPSCMWAWHDGRFRAMNLSV